MCDCDLGPCKEEADQSSHFQITHKHRACASGLEGDGDSLATCCNLGNLSVRRQELLADVVEIPKGRSTGSLTAVLQDFHLPIGTVIKVPPHPTPHRTK